jgi:hypothetical protein
METQAVMCMALTSTSHYALSLTTRAHVTGDSYDPRPGGHVDGEGLGA